MILIAGRAEVKPEKLAEARAEAAKVAETTRREAGCLEYGFHVPVESPTSLHVFERWESDEALTSHLAAPHTRAFLAAIAPMLAAPPALWRHEIGRSAPLEL